MGFNNCSKYNNQLTFYNWLFLNKYISRYSHQKYLCICLIPPPMFSWGENMSTFNMVSQWLAGWKVQGKHAVDVCWMNQYTLKQPCAFDNYIYKIWRTITWAYLAYLVFWSTLLISIYLGVMYLLISYQQIVLKFLYKGFFLPYLPSSVIMTTKNNLSWCVYGSVS